MTVFWVIVSCSLVEVIDVSEVLAVSPRLNPSRSLNIQYSFPFPCLNWSGGWKGIFKFHMNQSSKQNATTIKLTVAWFWFICWFTCLKSEASHQLFKLKLYDCKRLGSFRASPRVQKARCFHRSTQISHARRCSSPPPLSPDVITSPARVYLCPDHSSHT
jgi:hypothetical protein